MKKKSLSESECPIAKTLDCVGEWWSLLIIRDALHGLSRFDEFQKSLDIAPNMLTRRLVALVESGLLAKRAYSSRPLRHEYFLTEKGKALRPVLLSLLQWGNTYLATDSVALQLIDRQSEQPVDLVLVDRHTGKPISPESHAIAAGPAASEAMRNRIDIIQRHSECNQSLTLSDTKEA